LYGVQDDPSRRQPWARTASSQPQAAGGSSTVVSESELDTLSQRLWEMEQRVSWATPASDAPPHSRGSASAHSETAQRAEPPWVGLPPRSTATSGGVSRPRSAGMEERHSNHEEAGSGTAGTTQFAPSDVVLASRSSRSEASTHGHLSGMETGLSTSGYASTHSGMETGLSTSGYASTHSDAAWRSRSQSTHAESSAAAGQPAELAAERAEVGQLRRRAEAAEVQLAHERAASAALRLDCASAVEAVNTTLAVVVPGVAMRLPDDTRVHDAVMHLASRLGAATIHGAGGGGGQQLGQGSYTNPQRLELSRRAVIKDLSVKLAAARADHQLVADHNERLSARLANLLGALGGEAAAPIGGSSHNAASHHSQRGGAAVVLDRRPAPRTGEASVHASAAGRLSVYGGGKGPAAVGGGAEEEREGVEALGLCALIMQHAEALEGTQAQLAAMSDGLRIGSNPNHHPDGMERASSAGGAGGACNGTGKSAVRASKAASADSLQEMAALMAAETGALHAAAHVLLAEMEGNWLQRYPTGNEKELLRRLKQARAEAEGQRERAYKWKGREAELRSQVGELEGRLLVVVGEQHAALQQREESKIQSKRVALQQLREVQGDIHTHTGLKPRSFVAEDADELLTLGTMQLVARYKATRQEMVAERVARTAEAAAAATQVAQLTASQRLKRDEASTLHMQLDERTREHARMVLSLKQALAGVRQKGSADELLQRALTETHDEASGLRQREQAAQTLARGLQEAVEAEQRRSLELQRALLAAQAAVRAEGAKRAEGEAVHREALAAAERAAAVLEARSKEAVRGFAETLESTWQALAALAQQSERRCGEAEAAAAAAGEQVEALGRELTRTEKALRGKAEAEAEALRAAERRRWDEVQGHLAKEARRADGAEARAREVAEAAKLAVAEVEEAAAGERQAAAAAAAATEQEAAAAAAVVGAAEAAKLVVAEAALAAAGVSSGDAERRAAALQTAHAAQLRAVRTQFPLLRFKDPIGIPIGFEGSYLKTN
jgi:hypothetical protein